jgi:hypothetical protein
MTVLGRLREIANGCFVEAKHEGAVAARQTALEIPDGQKRVDTSGSPTLEAATHFSWNFTAFSSFSKPPKNLAPDVASGAPYG